MIMLRVLSLSATACIAACASDISPLSQKVLDVLERYRLQIDIDQESLGRSGSMCNKPIGFDGLREKIQSFLEKKQKLRLFIVSFPFKSSNTEKKVLSKRADLAERKCLEYLNQCLKELNTAYPYGVELCIFCDGIPFAEYRAVDEATVLQYEDDLRALTRDMPNITLITSRDIAEKIGAKNVSEICQRIDQYAPSDVDAYQQMDDDEKVKESVNLLLERFKIEFDSTVGQAFLKNNGGLEAVIKKLIAREMRMRNFIEDIYPPSTYVRLTVHYSKDVSKKFGIRLSPTSNIMPYHGVLVEEACGDWTIRFKQEIDSKRYEEASMNINGLDCRYMRQRHH